MRFVHISDVRIGMNTDSGRSWGRDRSIEVNDALKRAVDKAAELSAELVIISGGLFSHQPVSLELEEADRLFSRLNGAKVVIIAGESDMVKKSSPVRSYEWKSDVTYFMSGKPEKVIASGLNTVIYGLSRTDFCETGSEAFTGFIGNDTGNKETIRIALMYDKDTSAAAKQLEQTDISYAAVGGSLKYAEYAGGRICCAGGLEPEGISDVGKHGLIVGDISNATGKLVKLEFVPLASASYVPLMAGINTETTAEELKNIVEAEIKKRGTKNIYRIRIFGKRNPDMVPDLAELELKYRITEILDETEPVYDFEALFEEHSGDMIGYFISSFRHSEKNMSPVEKKAMFYGIDALLKTADGE